jgi:hypothetical protein
MFALEKIEEQQRTPDISFGLVVLKKIEEGV